MEWLLFWIGLAVIVGVGANTRGRSGFGWFILAILISPIIAGLLVLALGPARASPSPQAQQLVQNLTRRACPYCAEPVLPEARFCPHCRTAIQPIAAVSATEYPLVHNGIRYRRESDGSVIVATPQGSAPLSELGCLLERCELSRVIPWATLSRRFARMNK